MKRFLGFLMMLSMVCNTAVMAQKVNADAIKEKIEKAKADAANPKKGAKADSWISLGDAYRNSITEPTKALFVSSDVSLLTSSYGKGMEGEAQMKGRNFTTYTYPFFVVYALDGKVIAWTISKEIQKGAFESMLEAYNKAIEIDPSAKEKVSSNIDSASEYYKQLGNVSIDLGLYGETADAFYNVHKILASPAMNSVDPYFLYLTGYMYTLDGETNPDSYIKGEKVLKEAFDAGYVAYEDAQTNFNDKERGNIYYYAYHCAYAQKEKDKSKIEAAKNYLVEGVEKYPQNDQIFEGLLQLYTVEEGMGDPTDLLPTVEKNIAADPNNVVAWFARGRIYNATRNYDECIASFKKVIELQPQLFDANFYLGLFYMLKADELIEQINGTTYTDQAKYDADLEETNNIYAEAIPCFEAAHQIDPKHEATLDYLKQLCFRLRERDGVMEMYTKYNALYNEVRQ